MIVNKIASIDHRCHFFKSYFHFMSFRNHHGQLLLLLLSGSMIDTFALILIVLLVVETLLLLPYDTFLFWVHLGSNRAVELFCELVTV